MYHSLIDGWEEWALLNPDNIDVFLSYSSRRRAAAEHFARTLEAYGYDVWFDYKLIEGADFAFQLDERLRSAKVTLVMWCSLSVESHWVHEEADLATTLGRLLPVLMEPCDLKLGTRRLQYEDLKSWDGAPDSAALNEVLDALTRKTGKAPVIDHEKLVKVEADWIRAKRLTFGQYEVLPQQPQSRQTASTPVSVLEKQAPHRGAVGTVARSLIHPGKLTIGVFPYPPLTCGDDPHAMSGPWPMMAQAVAEHLGLEPEYRLTSFADLLENAYSSVDVVMSVFDTPRRRAYFDFSRPINRVALMGICREDLTDVSEDGLRAGNYRVLVQKGEVGWEFMSDEAPQAVAKKRMTSVDSIDGAEVLSLLRTGRYDLALMDGVSCLNFLSDPAHSGGLRLAFEMPLNMFESGIAVRKTSGLDLSQMNPVIHEIRNRPAYLEVESMALRGFERVLKRTGLRS